MRTLRVEVTAEDIAAGEAGDCSRCPIALAVDRGLGIQPGRSGVTATNYSVWDIPGCGTRKAHLPAVAMAFVRRFDRGEPVEPFAFDLELPEAQVTESHA